MADNPLANLLIRTGVVRDCALGVLLAADPEKERNEEFHSHFFKWKAGAITSGTLSFSAHTACEIREPRTAVVMVAAEGQFCAAASGTLEYGNIFIKSHPEPKEERFGSFRSVACVAGRAHAVGLRGMIYRLDEWVRWARIDEGLPQTFDIEAIHGFEDAELYAVGLRGAMWQRTVDKWERRETPTNLHLNAVTCAADDMVYVAGCKGILLRGRHDAWTVIEHEAFTDDIRDLEWFQGVLYVSTLSGVFRLQGDRLVPVDFGEDSPKSTGQLSAAEGVLWSIGRHDVVSFDGSRWTRVV
jgi:hypothetical protein